MPPRKRAPASDYDSDSGFVADAPRSKKSKTGSKAENGKDGKGGEKKDSKGGVGDSGGAGLDAKKGKVDGEEFWGVSFSWMALRACVSKYMDQAG